ncbi:MAG: beta-ketoacyl-[Paludibacteraceae bacterium]|nr:beta-ketoacyl-[acyl-carrier-protein] synthase family protein [Paludibacteraceae bacterium]
MRRVVITGMGIWSSIGQDLQTVTESLKKGRSGIIFDSSRIEYGLQSGLVGNVPCPDLKPFLSRADRIMLSEDAEYAYMAACQALQQAGLNENYRQNNEMGILWANDANSHQSEFTQIMEQYHCSALIGYNAIPKSVVSSAVINLSRLFHLTGINMNIAASCAGSIHALGVGTMFIQNGMQNTILVGASFENKKESIFQIAVDALYTNTLYNTNPQSASRPFDRDAIGSIPSGGAAAIVLEEFEHAKARGAQIYGEIIGYGFASGQSKNYYEALWEPEYQAMMNTLTSAQMTPSDVSLIVSHGDSFPVSDTAEAKALNKLCSTSHTPITATESITGHEGSMSGVARTIYGILMMQHDFVAPTLNLVSPIDEAEGLHIITTTEESLINNVLINAGGIGGIYNAIIIRKI